MTHQTDRSGPFSARIQSEFLEQARVSKRSSLVDSSPSPSLSLSLRPHNQRDSRQPQCSPLSMSQPVRLSSWPSHSHESSVGRECSVSDTGSSSASPSCHGPGLVGDCDDIDGATDVPSWTNQLAGEGHHTLSAYPSPPHSPPPPPTRTYTPTPSHIPFSCTAFVPSVLHAEDLSACGVDPAALAALPYGFTTTPRNCNSFSTTLGPSTFSAGLSATAAWTSSFAASVPPVNAALAFLPRKHHITRNTVSNESDPLFSLTPVQPPQLFDVGSAFRFPDTAVEESSISSSPPPRDSDSSPCPVDSDVGTDTEVVGQSFSAPSHELSGPVTFAVHSTACSPGTGSKAMIVSASPTAAPASAAPLKPFGCSVCGKCFKRRWELVRHVRVHKQDERPFECADCGKFFQTKATLASHRRIHSDEKPFACDLCGKRFKRKGELILHTRTHTGERPFKCPYCFKGFKQRGTLTQHLPAHTDHRPFSCTHPLCTALFKHKSSLTRHVRCHQAAAAMDAMGVPPVLRAQLQSRLEQDVVNSEEQFIDGATDHVNDVSIEEWLTDALGSFSQPSLSLHSNYPHSPTIPIPAGTPVSSGLGPVPRHLPVSKRAPPSSSPPKRKHGSTFSSSSATHVCDACSRRFQHKYSLTRHCKKHHFANSNANVTVHITNNNGTVHTSAASSSSPFSAFCSQTPSFNPTPFNANNNWVGGLRSTQLPLPFPSPSRPG